MFELLDFLNFNAIKASARCKLTEKSLQIAAKRVDLSGWICRLVVTENNLQIQRAMF
jgi:hypothetical protein